MSLTWGKVSANESQAEADEAYGREVGVVSD